MSPTYLTRRLGVFAVTCALTACASQKSEEQGAGAKQEVDPRGQVAVSTQSNLQWKRYAAFESDLARALALTPENLCLEFGKEPCVRKVHLVPLGGHEPFETGMLAAAAEPLATTPTVVERVVLNACGNRVDLDNAAGTQAKVFKHFSLEGAAPAPSATSTQALVSDLYRRLLARNAVESEREAVASLAVDEDGKAVPAAEFARLACFTIGTSAEFLFF